MSSRHLALVASLLLGCIQSRDGESVDAGASPVTLAPDALVANGKVFARLPAKADEALELREPRSGLAVSVRALDVPSAKPRLEDGRALYELGAGARAVFVPGKEGVEELRHLPHAGTSSLRWSITLGDRAAGLRLVDDVLEIVDESGTPRLRADRPWVQDGRGETHPAHFEVEGCAIDRSPAAPWGRAVTAPGAASCTLRLSFAPTLTPPLLVDPMWTATGTMTTTRQGWAVLLPSGKALLCGTGATCDLFDRTSKTFAATGSTPYANNQLRAATVLTTGQVLVTGGGAGVTNAELYDATTGAWTATGPMLSGRVQHTLTALPSGAAIAIGGTMTSGAVTLSTAEVFSGGTWTATGPLLDARYGHAAIAFSANKLLVTGGRKNLLNVPTAEIWSAGTGTFAAAKSPANTRFAHRLVLSKIGRPVVLGGMIDAGVFATKVEVYEPATDTWNEGPTLDMGRRAPVAHTLSDGRVFLGLGQLPPAGEPTVDVRILDTLGTKGMWVPIEPALTARNQPMSVLFPDDSILIAGGTTSAGEGAPLLPSNTAELVELLPTGAACTSDVFCATGFCVDKVCCATACNGACQACSAATKVSGTDGTCGNAKAGTDPHGTCLDDGSPACGNDGMCDGAGACRKYAITTGCTPMPCTADTDCKSGSCSDGICCDKACNLACRACTRALKGFGVDGVCEDVPAGVDPRNRCPADPGYPESCGADGQCDGAGACRKTAVSGTACGAITCSGTRSTTPACNGSGACVSTETDCGGSLCTAGVGCQKSCATDAECASSAFCEAGKCAAKKPNGTAAIEARTCASGVIADGVCCNDACKGACEACDATGSVGTCVAIAGAARHGTCPDGAGDVCARATCDGATRDKCGKLAGPEVVCRTASCDLGVATTEARCDGSGKCPVPKSQACAPFTCGDGVCKTTCAGDTDCLTGTRCDATTHRCVAPSTCDGASTVVSVAGSRSDCGAYRCRAGACLERCATSADCSPGYLCDGNTCVTPSAPAAEEGGCSMGHAGRARSPWAWLCVLGAVVALRRRARESAPVKTLLLALGLASCSGRRDEAAVDAGVPVSLAREARLALVPAGDAPKLTEVKLPRFAHEPVMLDGRIAVTPRGVKPVMGVVEDGLLVHHDAFGPGTALVRRPLRDGVEDLARVGEAISELRWSVLLDEKTAGLRLTSGVLELLDAQGVPRQRISAPWIVDASGARFPGAIELEGCAADRSTVEPWGRAVTAPGASECTVVVRVPREALAPRWVDPLFTTTGSMSTPRVGQGAAKDEVTRRVVVVGGQDLTTSEIYDPTTATWAMGPAVPTTTGTAVVAAKGGGVVLAAGAAPGLPMGINAASKIDGGTITALPPLVAARSNATGFRHSDGTLYVLGSGTTVESLAPSATAWTSTPLGASLGPTYVAALRGPSLGDFYVFSGTLSFVFKAATKTFVPGTPPSTIHNFAGLAPRNDGTVLVIGGETLPTAFISTVELFNPTTMTMTLAPSLGLRRSRPSAFTLPAGRTIVLGGTSGVYQPSAEALDLAATAWSSAGAIGDGRVFPSMVQLDDGRVLVAGGGFSATTYLISQNANGTACASGLECASGICVEGVCCDAACTGTCQSCLAVNKSSGADGTCGTVKSGLDPRGSCKDSGSPSCAQNGLCNGSGACDTYSKSSGCKPRPCTADDDCASGFCADGICCDKRCDGPCEACSADAKKGGVDGVCGLVPAGTDPRGRCPPDKGSTACKADGFCDGAGACRAFAPKGTPCGASTCTAGSATGPQCDGAGTCSASTLACAPFKCKDASACATSCTADADCADGAFCSSGLCSTKKANGALALAARECQSGFFADGVCCATACDGTCEACDVEASKGTCVAVSGAPHHGACTTTSADPCAVPRCDGADRKACKGLPGSDVVCRTGFCGDDVEHGTARCDGKGTCVASTVGACAPYRCAGDSCGKSCATDAECLAGFVCDTVTKTCVSGDVCDGDHTIKSPTGSRDCSPFKCAGSTCLTTCTDSSACIGGLVCDPSLANCVTPTPAAAESDGGCSYGYGGTGGWMILLLLLRRRRG